MVKRVQQAVGVTADGVFGAGTEMAVKKFQEENGLEATGYAAYAEPDEATATTLPAAEDPFAEPFA